jgi:hypothetical protein
MTTSITTRFVPSVHGFAFPNDFRTRYGPAINTWGLCNGMSHMAVDYFTAGRAAPRIVDVDFDRPLETGVGAALCSDHSVELFACRFGDPQPVVGKLVRGHDFGVWGTCTSGVPALIAPAATCWGPGRTDLLIVGGEAQIYIATAEASPLAAQRCDCNGWLTPFNPIGGSTAVYPAIASAAPGQLDAYHIDRHDRSVRIRSYNGGWQPDWTSLGAEATSGCAAVAHPGFKGVYIRGNDGAMWTNESIAGNWQGWHSIEGRFTSGPAAASPFPGRVEVYGRGLDGAIWINIGVGTTWSGWAPLGAPPGGTREEAPAAVSAYGLMQVYARATDGTVWRCRWEAGWQPWEHIDPPFGEVSKRLSDAIHARNYDSTVGPIIVGFATAGIGLATRAAGCYMSWPRNSDEQCFRWTVTDELAKLIRILGRGTPIPLGLINHGGTGHEVVAFGIESDSNLPPGSFDLPGDFQYHIHVYDPNHPDCDNVRISFHGRDLRRPIDRDNPAIRSSTGEPWRGCFVRDDYSAEPPPV